MLSGTPTIAPTPVPESSNLSGKDLRIMARKQAAEQLPDLDKADLDIVTDYFLAYHVHQNLFQAKEKVLKRIRFWYNKVVSSPCGSEERKNALRKLENLLKLIGGYFRVSNVKQKIGYGALPGICDRSVSYEEMFNEGYKEVAPSGLPPEIKKRLMAVKVVYDPAKQIGRTSWELANRETNSIIFMPKMENILKSAAQEDEGAAVELTRTSIIDPFGEILGTRSSSYIIASVIAEEAFHHWWFNEHGDDLHAMSNTVKEREAHLYRYRFLEQTLSVFGLEISKDEYAVIRGAMTFLKSDIESRNNELGLKSDDLQFQKF